MLHDAELTSDGLGERGLASAQVARKRDNSRAFSPREYIEDFFGYGRNLFFRKFLFHT